MPSRASPSLWTVLGETQQMAVELAAMMEFTIPAAQPVKSQGALHALRGILGETTATISTGDKTKHLNLTKKAASGGGATTGVK